MKNNNVAVIFGGMGKEHGVSLMSAEFVLSEIDREKFEPLPILITEEGHWLLVNDAKAKDGKICFPAKTEHGSGLLTADGFIPLFAAFPVLHGDFGEDGRVQGALECAGIPFVGCKTLSGAVCADKAFTKIVAEHLGIPTAPWVLGTEEPTDEYIKKIELKAELAFGYPMFIKPCGLGSSLGASRIETAEDFSVGYLSAAAYGKRVLVESALDIMCELECACFITKSKEIFTKIGSVFNNGAFYDYESKYLTKAGEISCTPEIDSARRMAIENFARALIGALSIEQLSRIDFFLTNRGEIIFNEINTLPGFTPSSLYPRLMESCGFSAKELITRLICEASL